MCRYKYWIVASICLGLLNTFGCGALAWPFVYPTGTTLYKPASAFDSYTLFAPLSISNDFKQQMAASGPTVYLANMRGDIVHRWNIQSGPLAARLLTNGNLIVMGQYPSPMDNKRPGWGKWWMGGAAGLLLELDWQGREVFRHINLFMHHDFVKLDNGNYLYLAWEQVPKNLQSRVRGGIKGSEHTDGVMFNDYLIEVDANGRIVWKWHANDHLDPKIDIIGPLYKRQEWTHANSIDVLPNGNILLACRSLDTILVIDRKSGKIIFRWGNPTYVDKQSDTVENSASFRSLGGPHDATVIPAGYPGAGNLLCFSNRTTDGDFVISRAAEIDPKTGKQVWETPIYALGRRLFSDYLGGAQRLPNGNTLICDGANGRLFQITKDHEIAWEFISPYMPTPKFGGAMFKARAYAPDYCPQFQQLPSAGGDEVVPPTVTEFKVTDLGKDLHAWRQYALAALACAFIISLCLNVIYMRQGKDGRKL